MVYGGLQPARETSLCRPKAAVCHNKFNRISSWSSIAPGDATFGVTSAIAEGDL